MQKKIENVIGKIKESNTISEENKPLILEKIEEWKKEESAINEIAVKLENFWLEVEPIFAELGLM
jgi:hypothetical protein